MAPVTRAALDLHPKVAAGGAAYMGVVAAIGALTAIMSDKRRKLPPVIQFGIMSALAVLPLIAAYLQAGDDPA